MNTLNVSTFSQIKFFSFLFSYRNFYFVLFSVMVVFHCDAINMILRFPFAIVCDPAGPGFDRYQATIDTRNVAQHSQCIHTNSGGRGTEERNCDQNWILGHCGEQQPASG